MFGHWQVLSMTENERQIPHCSLIFSKGTKIYQVMDVCVMYTCLNFVYSCGGYTLE
jgi:hypothetical protein